MSLPQLKNRTQRRAAAAEMRKRAAEWPEHLLEIPPDQWPPRRPDQEEYPVRLWRSRRYLVQQYACKPFFAVAPLLTVKRCEARRLSVNRVTITASGQWDADIPWEDLQAIKRETGHHDWYGVEIFPRDRDLVNVANMRHLWLLEEPLALGWFEQKGDL